MNNDLDEILKVKASQWMSLQGRV